MPPNTSRITTPVMIARAVMRRSEVAKARSTASPNRPAAEASRPKACTVSSASRLSPAKPTASANWSWVEVVSLRTRRPNRNIGTRITGKVSSTRPVSLGLTITSRISAPISVSRLRKATEIEVASRLSTMAMSVVSRLSTSPVRVCRKKAGSRVRMWR